MVARSRLADGRTWRRRGKGFSVVAMDTDESEVTRSRLADKERWGRKDERFSMVVIQTA